MNLFASVWMATCLSALTYLLRLIMIRRLTECGKNELNIFNFVSYDMNKK